MANKERIENVSHDIELDEQLDAQIKGWKWQRIGWLCMLLTTLGALLGLCGNGPLSYRTKVVDRDTLSYEYFLRYQGPVEIKLQLQQQTGITTIAVPLSYWTAFKVESITPEPTESRLNNDSLLYIFQGRQKGIIQFYLSPETRGSVQGTLVANNNSFSISHFIYP